MGVQRWAACSGPVGVVGVSCHACVLHALRLFEFSVGMVNDGATAATAVVLFCWATKPTWQSCLRCLRTEPPGGGWFFFFLKLKTIHHSALKKDPGVVPP